MRCPDCNKFVSYNDPEVTVNDVSLSDTTVTAEVRVCLTCQECGTELKDSELTAEKAFEHDCQGGPEKFKALEESGDDQFEIEEDGEPEGRDRLETVDRNGKQIKNTRYMTKYYGFELVTTVKCNCCEEKIEVNLFAEDSASSFNELT